MVGHLSNNINARIGSEGTHLSFMLLKEHWFRELYLGLKVTASFDRSECQAMESGVFVRTLTIHTARSTRTQGILQSAGR